MNLKKYINQLSICAIIFLLVNIIAYKLGADINWDLLNYHFYNGYVFLSGKFISNSLETVQSYLEPQLSILYYLLISNFSPLFVNLTIASIQSIGIMLIFFMSLNLFSNFKYRYLLAFLIALSSILGPIFISEIGSTMSDTLVAPLIILSCLFMVKASYEIYKNNSINFKKIIIYISFAGFGLGMAGALKFTNMVYIVGMFCAFAIVLMLISLETKKKLIYLITLCLGMTISFLIFYAPYGIVLYENFKNPIFPYFNNIFKSPIMPSVSLNDSRWFPKNLLGYIEMPFLLTKDMSWQPYLIHHIGMEIPFKTYLFAAIAILMPFYIFISWKKRNIEIPKLLLILFFVFSYIIWLIMFSYYRYIAALEMLAPLVIFLLISSLYKNYKNKYLPLFIAIFVLALSLMSYPYSNWGRIKPFPISYFGINKSNFQEYQNSMVIVGDAPLGFVLPYLPNNVKIKALPVRIPFTKDFQDNYYHSIRKWNKNMYYLSIGNLPKIDKAIDILKQHKLLINFDSCKDIKTNSFTINICKIEKVSKFDDSTIKNMIANNNRFFTKKFDHLFIASTKYLQNGNNPSNLYPQYLEENGYLDKSFGYQTGPANNWTQNGGWIGQWSCPDGKGKCFGVGMTGDIDILKPIINKYKSQALQIFFPYPKIYSEDSKETNGQLLMIFRAPMQKITSLPFAIDFTSKGNAGQFEQGGFCSPEPWGTWSCAKEISLSFDLTSYTKKPIYLTLEFNALVSEAHPQTFSFFLNGHLLAKKTFTANSQNRLSFDISDYIEAHNTLKIEIPDATSPKSIGINSDTRELGIGLIKAEISGKK